MHRRNFSLKPTDSLFQLKIFKQILYFQFVVLIPRRNLTLARQRYACSAYKCTENAIVSWASWRAVLCERRNLRYYSVAQ